MNPSNPGNNQGSNPDGRQGEAMQSADVGAQNFILINEEQGSQIEEEEMILGQVRRLDRVQQHRHEGNRQQGESGNSSGGTSI